MDVELGAIGVHHTNADKGSWDGPENEANLSSDAGEATFKKAFAWQDPDKDPNTKAAYKFIHHDVSNDGKVGAASVKGCQAGIAVLNGGRGGTTIPSGDKKGVYNHLAAHLKDANVQPPDMKTSLKVGDLMRASALIQPSQTKDMGDGVVEVAVSTPSVNRYGFSVDTDGIDISSFQKNPVVLFGHDADALPIGKSVEIAKVNGSLRSKTQFAVSEYPFANTVYQLVKGGYMNDVSIGLLIDQWSDDYETVQQSEMTEYSHVPVGANRDAKVIALALDRNPQEVEEEMDDFLHRFDRTRLDAHDAIQQSVEVLRHRQDALEAAVRALRSSGDEETKKITRVTLHKSAKAVATQGQNVIRIIKMRSQDADRDPRGRVR